MIKIWTFQHLNKEFTNGIEIQKAILIAYFDMSAAAQINLGTRISSTGWKRLPYLIMLIN